MTTLQAGKSARDLWIAEQSHRLTLSGAMRESQGTVIYIPITQALNLLEEQDSKLVNLKVSLRDILEQLRRESATQVALMRVEGQLHDLLAKIEASSCQ